MPTFINIHLIAVRLRLCALVSTLSPRGFCTTGAAASATFPSASASVEISSAISCGLSSAAGVGFSISVSATGAVSASCGTDFFFLSRVFIFFRKKGLFKRINHNTKYLSVSIYFPSFIIYAVLTLKVLYVIIFFGGLSVIRPE